MAYHLEAGVPGVVVVGDAKAESAKQVAAAVGEVPCRSCWCTAAWRSCDRRTMPPEELGTLVAAILAAAWRVTDGDAGINQRLGAFAGPVGVFAEVGLYVGWTSTEGLDDDQQPRVLMTRPAVMPLRSLTTR